MDHALLSHPSHRRGALLAAGLLAACALPPAASADAAGRRAPRLLTVQSLRVGTTAAPLTVQVTLPRHATLRAWVNGRRADSAFHHSGIGRRRALLTAHNGLRIGRNRIRLRAALPNGRRDVETRVVKIEDPIADAGHDRSLIAGRNLEIGVAPSGVRGRRAAKLQWSIADAPRGSDAELADPGTATPELVPDEPGTYTLRLTAGRGDDRSHDTLTVTVRPDDPPIGVPFETLSERPEAGVWIEGQPVANTYDRNGIFVVVLERRTRAVVGAGTTPRHGGGLSQLREMAAKYAGNDRYLMLVSGARGVSGDMGDQLRGLLRELGAPKQPDAAIDAATSGTPFSIVGIPGGVEGSAWVKFPGRGASVAAANLKANLQLNQAVLGTTPKHYDVVSPDHPTFDTRVGRPAATSNTIHWNGRDYSATLPPNATAGFHTLVVDPFSGAVLEHNPLTTNGNDTNNQVKVAADWLKIQLDRDPAPLVIMQSIGRPSGAANNWNAFVDQAVRLGANRYVLNALDGRTDSYALVGRPGSQAPGAEASTTTDDPGELTGVATPDRTLRLTPVASDPFGDLNTELVETAYQAPQAFPAFDTAGKKAAETFIGTSLGFCSSGSRSCEMRRRYHENYEPANWGQKSTDLGNLGYPDNASGFTRDEFTAVKAQLAREISAVSNVKHYFDTLQSPFDRTAGKSILDLNDLADRLRGEFAAPTGDATTSWALGLVSEIAAVGGSVESSVSGGLSAMSAMFSLVSYLTQENGTSVLGTEITTRAGELGHELYDRYEIAQQTTTGVALLFVSDWGKLQKAAGKLDNDWRLPPTMSGASASLKLSARRWFAESLVPTTFPYLLRSTPKPVGSGTAIGTECQLFDGYGGRWFYTHPWNRIDGNTQVRVSEAYENNGPRWTTLWPTRNFETYPKSDSVSKLLFNATDDRTPGLGLNKLAFFAPANFGGRVWSANDRARRCDLPIKQ